MVAKIAYNNPTIKHNDESHIVDEWRLRKGLAAALHDSKSHANTHSQCTEAVFSFSVSSTK